MKKLFLLISIFIINNAFGQQQGLTETYILNKLGVNAALASVDNDAHFTAIGQYGPANEIGSLKNYYLAIELPIMKSYGLSAQYSDFSNLLVKNNTVVLGLSKHFQLNDKTKLSFGLSSGVATTKYDYNSDYGISFVKEMDLSTSKSTTSSFGPFKPKEYSGQQYLLGGGVFLNADKWHFGFAIPNIIKNKMPDIADSNKEYLAERPAFFSVEKDIKMSDKLKLTSGGLYRFSKNSFQKGLDLQTSIWLKEKYSFGIWYQRIGAKNIIGQSRPLVAVVELIIKKARLAYNFNLNSQSNYTNIKQQVMLRLDIDYLKKKQNNATKI